MPTFDTMFEQSVLPATAKQLHLATIVQGKSWTFSDQDGTLTFARCEPWKVQVLGTQSNETSTWLWSWANEVWKLPMELSGYARALRGFGDAAGVPELTAPQVSIDERFNGDTVSLVACEAIKRGPRSAELSTSVGYVPIPIGNGAGRAYLLITDTTVPRAAPDAKNLPSLIMSTIKNYAFNHERAVRSYVMACDWKFEENGRCLEVFDEEATWSVALEFDVKGRLVQMAGRPSGGLRN